MRMQSFFAEQKEKIAGRLSDYLSDMGTALVGINRWGSDVCDRLDEFSAGGKMIRGGLVVLGFELFRPAELSPPESVLDTTVLDTAAAMELLQSSFLVHDDIMDRDEVRRGLTTVHHQYQQVGSDQDIPNSGHFGQAMGICAGDVAFFFAFDLLSRLKTTEPILRSVLEIAHRAVIDTCIAQMQDVFLGSLPGTPDIPEGDVLSVYHYKTGRYTFTLPLQLGAVLADVRDPTIMAQLSRLGELLGIIFQIKDDEIGLFGETGDIGKPVGSDVAEGKKTIFYVRLMQRASDEEKATLREVFGVDGKGERGLELMRELLARHQIRSEVEQQTESLAQEARQALDRLPTENAHGTALLLELLEYNLERNR